MKNTTILPKSIFEMGLVFEDEKNYSKAFKCYIEAAKYPYAEAQYAVGCCYYSGIGVQQNYLEAFNWFEKAANQNHLTAQYRLGEMYEKGIGVESDESEAVKWYTCAADRGHIEARNHLSNNVVSQKEVIMENPLKERLSEAQHRLAVADREVVEAQFQLAIAFEENQDYVEAIHYHRLLASDKGHKGAQCRLGRIYLNGDHTSQNYIEARLLLTQSAHQGVSEAQYLLGEIYEKGLGTLKNYPEAVKWFEMAAERGHRKAIDKIKTQKEENPLRVLDAQHRLDVANEEAVVAERHTLDAKQRHINAQYNLGVLYLMPSELQNFQSAFNWFEKAGNQGLPEAQINLGLMCSKGQGMEKDNIEALKWFSLAAAQGNVTATKYANATRDEMTDLEINEAHERALGFVQQ